uniref:Holin n=1 Tax=viral metagenome TaxID=1070528 RepID=A0A6M3JKG9_9ZZZZ
MIVGILWILVGIVVMLVGASRPDIDKMPALLGAVWIVGGGLYLRLEQIIKELRK